MYVPDVAGTKRGAPVCSGCWTDSSSNYSISSSFWPTDSMATWVGGLGLVCFNWTKQHEPAPPHPMQVVQCNPNFQRTSNITWIIANSHRLSRCTLFWCSRTHKCPWYIQIFIALVTTVCCQYDTFPLIGPTSNLKTSDIPHWLKVSHLPLIDEKKKRNSSGTECPVTSQDEIWLMQKDDWMSLSAVRHLLLSSLHTSVEVWIVWMLRWR